MPVKIGFEAAGAGTGGQLSGAKHSCFVHDTRCLGVQNSDELVRSEEWELVGDTDIGDLGDRVGAYSGYSSRS